MRLARWLGFSHNFRYQSIPELDLLVTGWLKRHAMANYCPNDLRDLHVKASNKLKSAQKRPSIIAACWMQATLW